ncbi:DNA alkylation repair protein [Desulfomonile tiedjei]|uniref:Putative DNA alkylation repair enzyme n=1 Tax=Desulfomonile tiedjei (strain ATCC 49306 / DSM 6799 / DCB-1) TaxID=706587 RepID=I4C6H0_DESTA|nr:DNA alkylation repair protein [Desulfomonile tiedjei]AFM25161.1 putative DNA alkylation repair enzyme [Desulfomonile tiedjei DSM 6799]
MKKSLPNRSNKELMEWILATFESCRNPEAVLGMARYGISPEKTYGISIPRLRKIAREVRRNHQLAILLWDSGIHEARILASMIAVPSELTEEQMDSWVRDLDSWDVCDQCCNNFFRKTPFAWDKALEWSRQQEELVKRAGFVLMATLAVHENKEPDERFVRFFSIIKRESSDERNFVRKAVNWALRQIGKRNVVLNRAAIECAERIRNMDSKAARWIAADALRELTSEAVQRRIPEVRRPSLR